MQEKPVVHRYTVPAVRMINLMTKRLPPICFLLALLAGCLRPAVIWIEPGATADNLVFLVARRQDNREPVEDLRLIEVKTCYVSTKIDQRVLWMATRSGDAHTRPPIRIQYGDAPEGFATSTAPVRLTQGCFEASISGEGVSAVRRFEVGSSRSLVEIIRVSGEWKRQPVPAR